MHELIYPILQGYDSYMLESDLTIVGSDQLFNEMMGRFFQQKFGQEPQVIITTKITPGLDGKNKQSKSLNNYIAITDTPQDKFGKAMSLPDNLIIQWLEVYTDVPLPEIKDYEKKMISGEINPRDVKLRLAYEITKYYDGEKEAQKAKDWFLKTFSKREFPDDAPTINIIPGEYSYLQLMKHILPNVSNSERKRLISQGSIKINNIKINNPFDKIVLAPHQEVKIKVGKRKFFKIIGKNNEKKT